MNIEMQPVEIKIDTWSILYIPPVLQAQKVVQKIQIQIDGLKQQIA